MSNLAGVSGTIGTIVGVGFTLGALGLTLEFVNRAFDRATPQQGKRRKYQPIFDTSYGNNRNMFQLPKSKGNKQSAYSDFFGGY